MGLDMFLYQKQSVYPRASATLKMKTKGAVQEVEVDVPTTLSQEIGYWRKANHIHNWFVENVQEGVDDCAEYRVSREKLSDLLSAVNEVLKSSKLVPGKVLAGRTLIDGEYVEKHADGLVLEHPETAKRLLPTQSGFFFGGTDYGESYVADLRDTKEILEYALELPPETEFSYSSSW